MKLDRLIIFKNYVAFYIDAAYIAINGMILNILIIIVLAFLESVVNDLVISFANFMLKGGVIIFYFVIISFNAFIQELFFSATLGKKVLGLIVTDNNFQKPTPRQIFIRNLVYPLDTFLVVGSLPLIMGKGKTLGGYISKTKLVSKKLTELNR